MHWNLNQRIEVSVQIPIVDRALENYKIDLRIRIEYCTIHARALLPKIQIYSEFPSKNFSAFAVIGRYSTQFVGVRIP